MTDQYKYPAKCYQNNVYVNIKNKETCMPRPLKSPL